MIETNGNALKRLVLVILLLIPPALPGVALGADGERHQPMDNRRLDALIRQIDARIEGQPGFWSLAYEGLQTYIITDENADRMRIIVQIAPSDNLDPDALYRMMQANFDTSLDARYAIAKGVVWSAFIHPLSPLTDEQFRAGFAQAVTLAATYGTTYDSGGLVFGGGDSQSEQQAE